MKKKKDINKNTTTTMFGIYRKENIYKQIVWYWG